jgi:hypothetical protein
MSTKLIGEVNLTMRYTNITNPSGTIIRYRYHRFMPVRIRLSRPSSKKSSLVEALRARILPSHFPPLCSQGEPPDRSSLRVLNKHGYCYASSTITHFSQAGGACWGSHCARSTRAFPGPRVARAQEPEQAVASLIVIFPHFAPKGSGQGCPLLRASDEHSFIVRVLRARRAPGHSPLPFSPLTEVPPTWL